MIPSKGRGFINHGSGLGIGCNVRTIWEYVGAMEKKMERARALRFQVLGLGALD